jgi:hypothetical protein
MIPPLCFVRAAAAQTAMALSTVSLSVSAAVAETATETVTSAYTPFDVDKCPHRQGGEVEDYGEWRCPGYAGIPVVMTAGDQRVYISYGARAKREVAAGETLASFNGEGRTIEWRIARAADGRDRPFATIMRWTTARVVDDPKIKDGTYRGQVLVVTRLNPGGVCHVGYVDGRENSEASVLARKIADEHARAFRCGKDKPIVLGNKGPGFSSPHGASDDK